MNAVRVLLAFGANVNLVNARKHTPLDVCTFLWITHERQNKISGETNNMERIEKHVSTMSDLTVPSPMSSPLFPRANRSFTSRTSNSWVMIDHEDHQLAPPKESRNPLQNSPVDSRGFTDSLMPIKSVDIADEFPGASSQPELLDSITTILNLLYSINAKSGKSVKHEFKTVLLLSSFSDSEEFQNRVDTSSVNPFLKSTELERSIKINDYIEGRMLFNLYEELDYNINKRLESQITATVDEAIALVTQQQEMKQFVRTNRQGIEFKVNGGSRLLFLDGGGIKGLVQIEVMRQIEEVTGRKITELFDWIIGSSIGGILALGLVYGKLYSNT